jgi:thymidylate kinase
MYNTNYGGISLAQYVRGIMLEGVSGVGKTSTLLALKQLQASNENNERSVIVLGEHYCQILREDNGRFELMNRNEHIKLLKSRLSLIEDLKQYACSVGNASRRSRGLFVILERFYLNHIVHFDDGDSAEMLEISERINRLGIKEVLLVASDEKHLDKHNNEPYDDLQGLSNEQIKQHNDWKTTFRKFETEATHSRIPVLTINTDGLDWNEYAKRILLFSEQ